MSIETPAPSTPTAQDGSSRRGHVLRAPVRGARAAVRASRRRVQAPLFRNGYALIASSALTSALGLVFWLIAARSYSTVAVGVASALIATSTTIANLSHLNLKSALNRFLPRAGGATFRLVTRSYALSVAIAGTVSLVFIAGVGFWSPRLAFLSQRPGVAIWFVLATMVWTIFVLEDSALTGVRSAVWVPLENLLYSVLKLAALPALVVAAPLLGAFVAWTAAVVPLVLAVNVLLFRRLLPAHARTTRTREEHAGAREIVHYVAADFAAYTVLTATIGLLPLVVLSVLGAKASAYYFVSWSVAYGMYLIPSGLGMSMISEAATEPARLADYDRQALLGAAKLLVPCVVIVTLAAPWLLELLGHDYAQGASTLLRLLVVSALPWTVFVSFTNAARVRRRMRQVVYATVALVGLVLAIGVPLMGPLGVDGLGVGWLAGQSLTAVGILAVRRLGRPRSLRPGLWKLIASAGRDRLAGRALGAHVRMPVWARNRARLLVRPRLHGVLPEVLAELGETGDRWILQREIPTRNDVAVGIIGRVGRGPAAVIKYARGPATLRSLRPHASALLALARAPRLPSEWRALVPRVIAAGPLGRGAYVAETCLPGRTMEALLRDGAEPGALLYASATAIDRLHTATGRSDQFDEALMAELVEAPLQRLCAVLAHRPGRTGRRAVAHLRSELDALAGTKLTSAWTHGDLSPGNILIDGSGTAVTGIVDWEAGTTRGVPQLDLLQLLISTRTAVEGRELGSVVVELRRDEAWHAHEWQAVGKLGVGADPPPTRTLVLLAWLAHVSANLRKSTRYAHNPLWLRRNVDPVLRSLLPDGASAMATQRKIVGRVTSLLRPQAGPAALVAGTAAAGHLPVAWPARPIARGHARIATRPETAMPLVALAAAVGLWGLSLPQIDPGAMTNMGLISVLPPAFPAALALLTFGFMLEAHRGARRRWVLVCHVFALVLFIHGTPEIVYGTLRYTWAYKHVGIVDYILRHGGVDPTIDPRFLNVYHDWPGFFALMALLAQLGGLHTVLGLAGWGPVFNNLLYLGALLFVFTAVTDDRRVIWVSCWLFYIADWVGQDYFSPQGFAFLLYLLLIGIVLRWLRPGSQTTSGGRRGALWLSAGLIAAIVVSHALTSVMVCIALAALVLARACTARRLLPIAAAMTAGWDLTFAWPYAGPNLASTLSTVHLPWETTSSNLANLSALSADQAFVANISRLLTVTVIALAVAGGVRLLRSHRLDRAVAVLAIAPIALFAAGNYDGEMLFRIYLFSLPFLALLGAQALAGIAVRARTSLTAVAALVLLAPFLVTYYGNERANYVTPQEVTAARWVDTHVPKGSQVVTATGCDVLDTEYYEHFTCVPFGLQPRNSVSRMLADPVAGLSNWMADPAYSASYVFLSRSQRVSVQENGGLPRGSLKAVQRKLVASPRFRVVYRTRDAIVLTLAVRQPRPASATDILRAQAR